MNQIQNIRLETLGLDIPIDKCVDFQDLGYMKDISAKVADICVIHQEQIIECDKRAEGFTLTFRDDNNHLWIYIGYKRKKLPVVNMIVRAHEETHALQRMRRLNLLEDALEREFNTSIMLSSYEEEIVAEIGALYALYKHGVSKLGCWAASLYNRDLFNAANRILGLIRKA